LFLRSPAPSSDLASPLSTSLPPSFTEADSTIIRTPSSPLTISSTRSLSLPRSTPVSSPPRTGSTGTTRAALSPRERRLSSKPSPRSDTPPRPRSSRLSSREQPTSETRSRASSRLLPSISLFRTSRATPLSSTLRGRPPPTVSPSRSTRPTPSSRPDRQSRLSLLLPTSLTPRFLATRTRSVRFLPFAVYKPFLIFLSLSPPPLQTSSPTSLPSPVFLERSPTVSSLLLPPELMSRPSLLRTTPSESRRAFLSSHLISHSFQPMS
jgi:hypothetical protein